MNLLKITCRSTKYLFGNINICRYCTSNEMIVGKLTERFAHEKIEEVFSKKPVDPLVIEKLINWVQNDVSRHSIKSLKNLNEILWEKINSKDVVATTMDFNRIFENNMINGLKCDPIDFILALKKKNLPFNNSTLDILARYYCGIGDAESALSVLEKMEELKLFLGTQRYSWMIGCYIRAKNPEKVAEYYKKLEEVDNRFSFASNNFIIRAYASVGDVENCIKIFESFYSENNKDIKSTDIQYGHYTTLIELYKSGANTETLKTFINYINRFEKFQSLLYGIGMLNKHLLFDLSLLVLEQTQLELSIVDMKILVLRFYNSEVPLKIMKVLLEKLTGSPDILGYVIRHVKPFDYALSLAIPIIQYNNIINNELIFKSLFINASNGPHSKQNIIITITTMLSRLEADIFYSLFVSRTLNDLFDTIEGLTYSVLLREYLPKNETLQHNFKCCFLIHTLVMEGSAAYEELSYVLFGNEKHFCDLNFEYLSKFVFENTKNINEVCQILLSLENMFLRNQYLFLLKYCLKFFTKLVNFQDYETFLKVLMTETNLKNFPENLNMIYQLKNLPDDIKQLLDQYKSEYKMRAVGK